MTADLVVHARWVIPVEPYGKVLDHHSIVVTDGKIVALLPTDDARRQFAAKQEVNLPTEAILPGLVNAHTHSVMTLLRGISDDQPLAAWLKETIWPLEHRFTPDPDFIRDGTLLAAAEMLRGGTTCFNDMYWYPAITADAIEDVGMRACIGLICIGFPSGYAKDDDEYIAKGCALADSKRHVSTLSFALAPHAPYTCSDELFRRLKALADERGMRIHTHVHETEEEVRASVALDRASMSCHQSVTAGRPINNLCSLGLVDSKLISAHMVHVNDEEIARYAEAGAHVVHCPTSNLKLAAGFCPVAKMIKAGVNVAIGTDGAASNDALDMMQELKLAAILAKGVAGDATVVPAAMALQMATLNGARALGLDHITGSLVPGKAADFFAVHLGDTPETAPVYHPIDMVVYSAGRESVTDVWVAGKHLLASRTLTTINEKETMARAKGWIDRIRVALADRATKAEPS